MAGIGGDQAVALVGAPLAIGLPVALERPFTRGRLTLASSDPSVQPAIELNFADDADDWQLRVERARQKVERETAKTLARLRDLVDQRSELVAMAYYLGALGATRTDADVESTASPDPVKDRSA